MLWLGLEARRSADPLAADAHMTRQQRLGLLAATAAGVAIGRAMASRNRYSFRDRSVVITGGSRGLGLEIARLLAREGASLTLIARDEDELSPCQGFARACRRARSHDPL